MIRKGQRRVRPRLKWILLAVAAAGIFCAYRVYWRPARGPSYPPSAFFEVRRNDMLISIVEDGALRALNETTVRSMLDGLNRIITLVPEGAHVKKGDLLVELDSWGIKERLNDYELEHQERLNQMLQAEGNVKIQKGLAESQVKDAELAVENAQSDLEKYRDGDAPLLIKTVEARAGVLAEQVRISRERYARTQELFKGNSATRSEVEADALSLNREQLAFEQYNEDLRLIKKFDQPKQIRLLESKVQQAGEELDRIRQRGSNEVAQAEADLKTSQRSVSTLEETINLQKRRLTNAKILAPQDGLVVYASVSPFQNMGGGNDDRAERFRRERQGGGRGGGNAGEFRGGGRRGGRSDSQAGSGGSSSSSPSSAQAVGAANQRIASAISGSSATQPTGSGGGSSSSSASRSSGSSGGSSSASPSSAFVTYQSMRASSTISTNASAGFSSSSAAELSSSSVQPMASGPQFGFRPSSQNNFSQFDFSGGTPGFLEEGLMVRQRQELIRLPDVSKMVAEIKIHESRVRQVRAGMTAYVRVENIPNRKFKGSVRRVAPLPDAQTSWMQPDLKVFPTDILVEEELPDLKPGVSVRAEVVITNLTKVLSVPIQTVARFRGENVCFIKNGHSVKPTPVTTGWFNDRFVEITSGLKEGDKVLLAPAGDEASDILETSAVPEPAADEAPAQAPTEPPAADETRGPRRNRDANADGENRPRRRGARPNTQETPE